MRPTSKMTNRLSFDMDIPSHDRRVVRSQPEALLPAQFRQLAVAGTLSVRARLVNAIAALIRRPCLPGRPAVHAEMLVAEPADRIFLAALQAWARRSALVVLAEPDGHGKPRAKALTAKVRAL